MKVGFRQGCVMSPWLFNLYMDGVVREVQAGTLCRGAQLVGTCEEKWEASQLLFADDTVLVADSKKKLLLGFPRLPFTGVPHHARTTPPTGGRSTTVGRR